jgi:hypothetical protein
MPKITALFNNNDKKVLYTIIFKEKLMKLLAILTGGLQAYNTRQVQHFSGWSNNLKKKACLEVLFVW